MFRYDRLDQLIAETGKKKNYLSKKMGHSGRYLNDAKKQNTNIKKEEVYILAVELGVSLEYLTGETDEKNPSGTSTGGISPIKQELLDRIPFLSDKKVQALLDLIDGD